MKLPFDNFQILGISPASNTRNILTILQKRLENSEYTDITPETVKKRNKLLKEYSKPLLDEGNRKELECIIKTINDGNNETFYLTVSKGYEVSALLLLLECQHFEECFDLSSSYFEEQHRADYDILNPDLFRIIAHATLKYARELKANRYYERSANTMEQGLLLLNKSSITSPIHNIIQAELADITPFRILDLLSRNTNEPSRELGLSMLHRFVLDRGGLDGESYLYMSHNEFKAFFRQIRCYLTLQEQLDLYQQWSTSGSNSARFLFGISLVACGFSRRKPERLVQALDIMNILACDELKNIIIYIYMLLGNVNNVEDYVALRNKSDSKDHANPTNFKLASVCSDCREWLEVDVLDGYRDVEIDSDLEAYFGDSDVTSFIEKNDASRYSSKSNQVSFNPFINYNLSAGYPSAVLRSIDWNHQNQSKSSNSSDHSYVGLFRFLSRIHIKQKKQVMILIAMVALATISLNYGIVQRRNKDLKYFKTPTSRDYTYQQDIIMNVPHNIKPKSTSSRPHTASFETELSTVISKWLAIKAFVLSGEKIPRDVELIATTDAIKRLQIERQEDQSRGEIQKISANLINLRILNRQAGSVLVNTKILYSDYRLDSKNRIIDKTAQRILQKQYILVNENSNWRLQ